MVSVIPAFILAHAHLLLLQLRHHGLEATPETILRAVQKASAEWDVVRDSHLVLICAEQGGAATKATEGKGKNSGGIDDQRTPKGPSGGVDPMPKAPF